MSLIETPCIKVCVVDRSGHCVGCGRSLSEIASWSTLTSEARRRIIATLPQRLQMLGYRPAGRSSCSSRGAVNAATGLPASMTRKI